jgi:hypothetical protein
MAVPMAIAVFDNSSRKLLCRTFQNKRYLTIVNSVVGITSTICQLIYTRQSVLADRMFAEHTCMQRRKYLSANMNSICVSRLCGGRHVLNAVPVQFRLNFLGFSLTPQCIHVAARAGPATGGYCLSKIGRII